MNNKRRRAPLSPIIHTIGAMVKRLLSVIIEMDTVHKMTPEERKKAAVAKQKRYLEKNREKVNARRRERYAKNKERINAKRRTNYFQRS